MPHQRPLRPRAAVFTAAHEAAVIRLAFAAITGSGVALAFIILWRLAL